jgi:hypothetical protein
MAWGESKTWKRGSANQKLYQGLLDNALEAPARNAKRRKVLHPEDMPWEMSRQGLLKHLLNEQMNTRMETVDAYMQIIPPGSRSGKHATSPRNATTWSGAGLTCTRTSVEDPDTYHWKPQAEVKRWEWEAGTRSIPPNVIAALQREQGQAGSPRLRVSRIYKYCGLNDLGSWRTRRVRSQGRARPARRALSEAKIREPA